ncbi:MAG: polymerase subunit sigma [Rubritepida sp.]|nr:polymerase subunit sigma [Rubritepida sp.]
MPQDGPLPPGLEQALLGNLNAAHNLARWLVRDPAAAEDVVQEAMLRAIRYAASWRGGDGRAWLLEIVRNTAHGWLAARRHRQEVPMDETPGAEAPDPAPDPEAALSGRQERLGLAAAVAALPVELRECLVLREFEELSYRDIARVTGVPIGTVMSRLWRARRALLGTRAERIEA